VGGDGGVRGLPTELVATPPQCVMAEGKKACVACVGAADEWGVVVNGKTAGVWCGGTTSSGPVCTVGATVCEGSMTMCAKTVSECPEDPYSPSALYGFLFVVIGFLFGLVAVLCFVVLCRRRHARNADGVSGGGSGGGGRGGGGGTVGAGGGGPSGIEMKTGENPFKAKGATSDWSPVVDPASGETYYYNEKTHETTWDKPQGVGRTSTKLTPSSRDSTKLTSTI
jgi:hypothetical protein